MTAHPDFFTTFAGLALTARSNDDLDSACRVAATGLGVDGVGVTLGLTHTLRAVIGASDNTTRLLEEAQLTAGEGPCTLATRSARTVLARDLTDPAETRWPGFVHQLHRVPVRAVIAVPLTVTHNAIGSLDIHSLRPGGLDHLEPSTLTAVADTMNQAVLYTQLINQVRDEHHTNWVTISQATGMVIASLHLTSDQALARLRATAFLEDRWLSDIASDIVTGQRRADLDAPRPCRPPQVDRPTLNTAEPGSRRMAHPTPRCCRVADPTGTAGGDAATRIRA